MSYLPKPSELKSASQDLLSFLKSPIEFVKKDPEWEWPTSLVMTLIVSCIVGAFAGAISLRLSHVFRGAIIYPISSIFTVAVFTAFFYYTLLFFFKQQSSLKKLYALCFLSAMPWILVAPLVDLIPLLSPIGIILSGMLAIVMLSENFNIQKKQATRLIAGIVSVFLIFWMINLIRVAQFEKTDSELITPESLDIIEQELEGN